MFKRTKKGDTTTIVVCFQLMNTKMVFSSSRYGIRVSLQKWREYGNSFAVFKTINLEEVSKNLFKVSKSVALLEKGVDFV